jgi:23S rRNA (cytosine1962-C5)-methyltransferase
MPLEEYRLLDSGNLMKLEQAGPYRIIRPALNAFWKPALPESEWNAAQSVFERNSSGGGKWHHRRGSLPDSWQLLYNGFKLLAKPTNFGHLGFFAEQYDNWNWTKQVIRQMPGEVRAMNLFAYSGVGSMAMAAGGAQVCHVDAAQGMIEWGRQNQTLNPDVPDSIRWIVDDVLKFAAREIRRGAKYNGIALDPPSFGRGPKGQVWKMEDGIGDLIQSCRQLIDERNPYFIILSCHSPGFSPLVLKYILRDVFGKKGKIESMEMSIPDSKGRPLPAGVSARLLVDR